jgi:hypothetical protein
MKILFLLACAHALAKPCHVKDLQCEVAGHSETPKKVYYAICTKLPRDRQLEFSKDLDEVSIVDSISRQSLGTCEIEKAEANLLIRAYEKGRGAVENPPCYLSQWKGQMMFVAHGKRGRCTFEMKREQEGRFEAKTGKRPLYQCEGDYFLVESERKFSIYKRSQDTWTSECIAPLRVGDPVEDIDWKNPPKYYHP